MVVVVVVVVGKVMLLMVDAGDGWVPALFFYCVTRIIKSSGDQMIVWR